MVRGRERRGLQSFKEPGNSLVSVCQRSIFLSLFLRQSNQCLSRSPFALMPRETPPGGGRGGDRRGGRDEGESSAVTPLAHGRRSQHQRADARGRCWCRLGVLATGRQKSGTDLALKDDEVDECRRCNQTAFVNGFMVNSNCLFMVNE